MRRELVLVLASATALLAPAKAASVRFSIEEGSKVGHRAVGLVCFPKQPLRWDRQYRPDGEDIMEVLRDRFGTDAADLAKGDVVALKLSICQKYWGPLGTRIGDRRELKGKAEMEVRWTFPLPKTCRWNGTTRVEMEVTPEMRGGIPGVLLKALDVNAAEAAAMIKSSEGCSLSPQINAGHKTGGDVTTG